MPFLAQLSGGTGSDRHHSARSTGGSAKMSPPSGNSCGGTLMRYQYGCTSAVAGREAHSARLGQARPDTVPGSVLERPRPAHAGTHTGTARRSKRPARHVDLVPYIAVFVFVAPCCPARGHRRVGAARPHDAIGCATIDPATAPADHGRQQDGEEPLAA